MRIPSHAPSSFKPLIEIICAVSADGVFGYKNPAANENQMPWSCKADMTYFKNTTTGHPVVMGSDTYFSLPEKFRPLPGRTNLVLTTNSEKFSTEIVRIKNLNEVRVVEGKSPLALDLVANINLMFMWIQDKCPEKVFIIGGKKLITQMMSPDNGYSHHVSRIHRTVVHYRVFGEIGAITNQETYAKYVMFDEMLEPSKTWPHLRSEEPAEEDNCTIQVFKNLSAR